MARWSPGRIGWTAAAGALALSGCDKLPEAERGAPPRANDAIELEAQNSVIAVPVEIGLDQIHAALERAVPRQLWTIDERGQTCIASDKVKVLVVRIKTPKIKCDLVGEVTRGPLGLSGRGRDLVITMPIRATVRAKRIAGIIEQETATASAQVRGVVRLDMGSDWSPRGRIEIDYNWTREPGIDFLGQRIKFTGPADAKLKGVVARLERTLPGELAKLGVRQQVTQSWRQAFTSLNLNRANPPVWMRIAPQELQYGGYAVRGRRLILRLGMAARTETFVGTQPEDPPAVPLPPVRPMTTEPGAMQFFIPVIADYAQLEPVVQKALVKRAARPFDLPGIGPVNARFGKVTNYGTTGNRIAVGAGFTARDAAGRLPETAGTLWLTALPVNPPDSREVQFRELKVAGVTNGKVTDLLLQLANAPAISQTIAGALSQNFSRDYDALLGKIGRAIDTQREGRLVIRARIDNVRTEPLRAAGRGLYLPVWGTGTAAIEVQPR